MDCKTADSKKLFKVFEASKRKKSRKRRDGHDDSDGSTSFVTVPVGRTASAEASLQNVAHARLDDIMVKNRDLGSSPDVTASQEDTRRSARSPRRHRRPNRDSLSLALKPGMTSSPPSGSPRRGGDAVRESIPHDQDSFIYTFLEEAIKKGKKKQRHSRRHEERQATRDCDHERSRSRDHERRHHHHRRRRDEASPHARKHHKESSPTPSANQVTLLETFAKLCTQMNEISLNNNNEKTVQRCHSHKSLQCEVQPKDESSEIERSPVRMRSNGTSVEHLPRTRSHEHVNHLTRSPGVPRTPDRKFTEKCACCGNNEPIYSKVDVRNHSCSKADVRQPQYCSKADVRVPQYCSKADVRIPQYCSKADVHIPQYCSKADVHIPQYCSKADVRNPQYYSKMDLKKSQYCCNVDVMSRTRVAERYSERTPEATVTRSRMDAREPLYIRESYRDPYKDYDERMRNERVVYEDEDQRNYDHKTSRSFNVRREVYVDDDKMCRRTVRSDGNKDKRFEELRDPRFEDQPGDKYYEESRERRYGTVKDKRSSRKLVDSRYDRASLASRDEDYKERCSERALPLGGSGLSVADGEASTVSGRSHYMRAVKQEIIEQREAMDKMMKLWKELMKCFKGISSQGPTDKNFQESAENARDSAAAQLKLWRECMRRYETVARDVGDTDARLMEEINKQRSEMAEMSSMWQECLQRYRDMTNDFNTLKQQVNSKSAMQTPADLSSRLAAPPPLLCAEGEGSLPAAPYRLPNNYPLQPPPVAYGGGVGGVGGGGGGSPLRYRASAPPAWWWEAGGGRTPRDRSSPRRARSPDSRGSRDRRHRHKERDREDTRYREKSSKPSGARSEHRHRKR